LLSHIVVAALGREVSGGLSVVVSDRRIGAALSAAGRGSRDRQ
jgi:hypothetical protein